MKKQNTQLNTLGKGILFLAVIAMGHMAHAQQKVNDGTVAATAINPSAIAEYQTLNKGILMPRIALTSTTAAAPLSAHVAGMQVYNTATAGTAPNNVTPGVYYNDGTKWLKALAETQPAYYTRLGWSSATTQDFPLSVATSPTGVAPFTIPTSGKYLIIYHSFLLNSNPTGPFSFYTQCILNGSTVKNEETYSYVAVNSYFNTHYSTVITANAGDILTFKIQVSSGGGQLQMHSSTGARNLFDIIFIGK